MKGEMAWYCMRCFCQHTMFIKMWHTIFIKMCFYVICSFGNFLFQILAVIALQSTYIKSQGFCEQPVLIGDPSIISTCS